MSFKEKFASIQLQKKQLLVLAALIVLFLAFRLFTSLGSEPELKKEPPLVRTVTIGSVASSEENSYPGEVRGRYESNLAFQVSGKIVRRVVNLGDAVVPGQVLMEIDARDVVQAVKSGNAALEAALSQQRLAGDNARRYEMLYQSGAVSKATMEYYQNQETAASAAVRQAEAQFAASGNQLEYTRLTADFAGVVAAVNGEAGQIAAAGVPMITLIKNGEKEVQFFIPENRAGKIKVGQKVSVVFWALGQTSAVGTVREIAPAADTVTRTYKARLSLEDAPSAVKLGMTAKVRIESEKSSAVLLPGSAIYQTDSTPKVWLVKDNRVYLTPVVVAGYSGNKVRIERGLAQGDVVVAGGTNKLTEGQMVRPEAGVYE